MQRTRQSLNPVVITLAVVTALFFIFPLTGLLIRTPWSSMGSTITGRSTVDALRLSAIASLATTALALAAGGRSRHPGRHRA